jgi:hypothetical protein
MAPLLSISARHFVPLSTSLSQLAPMPGLSSYCPSYARTVFFSSSNWQPILTGALFCVSGARCIHYICPYIWVQVPVTYLISWPWSAQEGESTQHWAYRAFIVELVWLSEPVSRLGGHIVACWLSGWICKCQPSLQYTGISGTGRSKLHDLQCTPSHPPTPNLLATL